MSEESGKRWYESREIWVVVLYLVNFGLNQFGLSPFEPTAEFNAGVVVVLGVLRGWFTSARIEWGARQ